jgi:large subunit ribosomal protein L29
VEAQEIRLMSEAELDEALRDAREELFNLRFQQATGRLADTSRVVQVKRDVARLLTVRREREIWAEYEASVQAFEAAGAHEE